LKGVLGIRRQSTLFSKRCRFGDHYLGTGIVLRYEVKIGMEKFHLNGVAARSFRPLANDLDALCAEIKRRAALGEVAVAQLLRNYAFVAYPRNRILIETSQSLPLEYNSEFYNQIDEFGPHSASLMLQMVRRLYHFESVLDVGAGSGTWLEEARKCGATRLSGIEALWYRSLPVASNIDYQYCDLNGDFPVPKVRFDLVLCLEVAEHLLPQSSQSLVAGLCSSGSVIVFGAGLERQYGNAHSNCRRQEFWISLFLEKGFRCFDLFRPKLWYSGSVSPWYRQNTLVFADPSASAHFQSAPAPTMLNVYHPQLLFYPVDEYVKMDHAHHTPLQ
jgi:SAM-dependent methyltransferase